MVLKVSIDDRSMRRFIRQMPMAGRRSIARSLNKAITQCRTRAAREISDKRNIKVGRARQDMRIKRASYSVQEAAIIASGNPIRVIEVKGVKSQTKKGVAAKIEAKGKRHLFKGAFIATLESGHTGVFERVGHLTHVSKSNSKGTRRFNLPIRELTLPSVPATLVAEEIDTKLRAYAAPVYEAELERLLNLEMVRAGAK